ERLFGGHAGRDLPRSRGELVLHRAHRGSELLLRKVAAHPPLEFAALVRRQRRDALLPRLALHLAALAGVAPELEHVGRHLEGRRAPTELLARALDLVGAERRAVRLFAAGLGRRAEADGGATRDQARTIGALRLLDRGRDGLGIVAVDASRRPA